MLQREQFFTIWTYEGKEKKDEKIAQHPAGFEPTIFESQGVFFLSDNAQNITNSENNICWLWARVIIQITADILSNETTWLPGKVR